MTSQSMLLRGTIRATGGEHDRSREVRTSETIWGSRSANNYGCRYTDNQQWPCCLCQQDVCHNNATRSSIDFRRVKPSSSKPSVPVSGVHFIWRRCCSHGSSAKAVVFDRCSRRFTGGGSQWRKHLTQEPHRPLQSFLQVLLPGQRIPGRFRLPLLLPVSLQFIWSEK